MKEPNKENIEDKIKSIIVEQYYDSADGSFYKYYGNDDQYDYSNNIIPDFGAKTGYSRETLSDEECIFYIIHPDELNIVRNIRGSVVNTVDTDKLELVDGLVKSKKIVEFWRILNELDLVRQNKSTMVSSQTELARNVLQLAKETGEPNALFALGYVNAIKYKCEDDFLHVWTMLQVSNNSLRQWYGKSGRMFEYEKFQALYKNNKGDLAALLEIKNRTFNKIFNKMVNVELNKFDTKIKYGKQEYIESLNQIYSNGQGEINMDRSLWETFYSLDRKRGLDHHNDLSPDEYKRILQSYNYHNDFLLTEQRYISDLCSRVFVDNETLVAYLTKYFELAKVFNDTIKTGKNDTYDWFKKLPVTGKIPSYPENKILRTFLCTYPSKIAYKTNDHRYIYLLKPAKNKTWRFKKMSKKFAQSESALSYQPPMVFYLNADNKEFELSVISSVSPDVLMESSPKMYDMFPKRNPYYSYIKQHLVPYIKNPNDDKDKEETFEY